MSNGKVTISDIAKELNVSIVSVSRALAEQPGVSDELKKKITEKAGEMGYTKNKKNEQLKILILYQQAQAQISGSSNISYKLQCLGKTLQEFNAYYHIEFIDRIPQESLTLPYILAQGFHFDGAILIGCFGMQYVALIKEKIKQMLFFTGYSPSYDFDCIWYDFKHAGYKACEYLLRNGHRQIGFIGHKPLYRNSEKLAGIMTALEAQQLPFNPRLVIDPDTAYQKNLLELINGQNAPTAFICDYDLTALELIQFLHANRIKVPADLSVIGSGNTEISHLAIPALTTIDVNIGYACKVAVETLVKRINFPDLPYQNIAILSNFIERDSVRKY